jgi:RNA polymerase sigma-70 factor, ECF subfamily
MSCFVLYSKWLTLLIMAHYINQIENDFGTHLHSFIRSRVSNTHDAEDIYQDVMLKILSKSDTLTSEKSLKSWLYAITKNQIIDYYRSRKSDLRKNSVAFESQQIVDEVAVEDDDTEAEFEICLRNYINQLPDDYREIILKSELDGVSQKELSQQLGLNYVTLRSKVQRGRNKIKENILKACVIELDAAGRVVDCIPRTNVDPCADALCD